MAAILTLLTAFVTAPQSAASAPTFTEHVAPIVFARCAACHRPGEVAPFPLLTYRDVSKRAATIVEVVEARFMPPWHPVEGHGEFQGNARLTDGEVATIRRWVDADCPEGPTAALPPAPQFPTGWQLGEPDLVVGMAEAFAVPAAGRDIYRNFTIPLELPADRWVAAIEIRTTARDVLHHVLFFLDPTGEGRRVDGADGTAGFSGMRLARQPTVGGWAVGGRPERLPQGLGVPLPKGNDLILQCHFHPSGRAVMERITVGLHFCDAAPERTIVPIQLPPFFGLMAGLDIPAGTARYVLQDSLELPCAVAAVTVGGHAHMLCRSMRMWAELPPRDGAPAEPVRLLYIDDWDFDWQNRYTYRAPVPLPAGAVVHAELVYDNSEQNPNNPNRPPRRVRWGRETTDEMGSITLMVVPADEADLELLQTAVRGHARAAALARVGPRATGGVMDALERYDRNRDDKLQRDEVPRRLSGLFDSLDKNGDGVVDAAELRALQTRRDRDR